MAGSKGLRDQAAAGGGGNPSGLMQGIFAQGPSAQEQALRTAFRFQGIDGGGDGCLGCARSRGIAGAATGADPSVQAWSAGTITVAILPG